MTIMLQRSLCNRKRYIQGAVAAYLVVLVCMVFWWQSHDRFALPVTYRSTSVDRVTVKRIIHSKHVTQRNKINYVQFILKDANKIHDVLSSHFKPESRLCNGRFVGCANLFASLRNVSIYQSFGHGRRGGENISAVLNQAEDAEYYRLERGFFSLQCKLNGTLQYNFNQGHLKDWITALTVASAEGFTPKKIIRGWTIAVQRYEYANLYHTMTDFYNAFLLASYFKMNLPEVNILWIDGHPNGALDDIWRVLFGKSQRVGDLNDVVLFENMVWNIMGYDSMLNNHDLPVVPMLEEFRSFFMSSYGIYDTHTLDCANLTVLFLWRRDYLAHPRNPLGQVSRKVKNEDELLNKVKTLLPGHTVRGVQIDTFDMSKQLKTIAETDILIGMHGAGLTHTLFLPQTSGLIELYPTYWPTSNRHFRAMAQWRKLHYQTWQNDDPDRELPNQYTIVDPVSLENMVHEMHHKLCKDKVHNDNINT